jgi:predicted Zn finger-like uncharacterized protein
MARVHCPHCDAVFRVDDKYMGRKVPCPKCRKTFALAASAASQTPVPADAPEGLSFAELDEEPPANAPLSPSATFVATTSALNPQSAGNWGSEVDAQQRYPNLMRYLGLWRILFTISLVIGLCAAGVTFVGGLYAAHNNTSKEGTAVISAICIALATGLAYMVGMAGIEFIKVIIDVEANTRAIAARSHAIDNVNG